MIFTKCQKNTTGIPAIWQKSGICQGDLIWIHCIEKEANDWCEICLKCMQKTWWVIKTDTEYHPPMYGTCDIFMDKKIIYFPRAGRLLVIYCESITHLPWYIRTLTQSIPKCPQVSHNKAIHLWSNVCAIGHGSIFRCTISGLHISMCQSCLITMSKLGIWQMDKWQIQEIFDNPFTAHELFWKN